MRSREERRIVRHSSSGRFILGALVVVAGILLIFKNIGILPYETSSVIFSWQMLVIAIGVLSLARHGGLFTGVILIAIGSFFLFREYTETPEMFTKLFWGAILMLIGLLIILRAFRFRRFDSWHKPGEDSSDYIDELAVFGGGEKRIVSLSFKGGKITSIFGGSTIDFADSKLADGQNVLDVVSIFGGFKIIVPADWIVKVETASILGGISDKRTKLSENPASGKILIIKGIAIFGGGEIKSYG